MVEIQKIKHFRKSLRQFERLIESQKNNCCNGVTMAQCHVLLEIEELGETTAGELSGIMNLDKSTLSRTINGLVKQGLVKRGNRSGDRRFTPVTLTDSGRENVDLINRDNNGFFRDVFSRITPEEHENLLCCFSELVRAMGAENTKCTEGKTCCSHEMGKIAK